MRQSGDVRMQAPTGFLPTGEMRRIMDAKNELVLIARAYDCTGEEVGSVEEAHTVVVMILEGDRVVYEEQVEGSPCMMPARKR